MRKSEGGRFQRDLVGKTIENQVEIEPTGDGYVKIRHS
jgi:hypothetical protein